MRIDIYIQPNRYAIKHVFVDQNFILSFYFESHDYFFEELNFTLTIIKLKNFPFLHCPRFMKKFLGTLSLSKWFVQVILLFMLKHFRNIFNNFVAYNQMETRGINFAPIAKHQDLATPFTVNRNFL